MSSWTSQSMWSRETSAASFASDAFETPADKKKEFRFAPEEAIEAPDSTEEGPSFMTTSQLEHLFDASIRGLAVTVTIAGRSAHDASPIIVAASRGAEEMYEWPRESLLGDSWRILEARSADDDLEDDVKLMSALLFGEEVSVVQTQRKASGELFKAFQYHRGLSMGFDPQTGDEVWYLLTVGFDISADLEHEREGHGSVDWAFFREAGSSIAGSVKSSIVDAVSIQSSHQVVDSKQVYSQSTCGEASRDGVEFVRLFPPAWVVCPPESRLLFHGMESLE